MARKTSLALWAGAIALLLVPIWPAAAQELAQTPEGAAVAARDPEGAVLPALGKKNKKEDEATKAAPGPGGPPAKKEDPAFDDVVKDAEKVDGLFTVYRKDERHLLALRPEQLEKDYMISVTRESGIGQSFLLAAQVLQDGPARFRKVGKRVQLVWGNPRFAAKDDPDIRRAVDKSFSESLIASSRIESQPEDKTGAVLVDLAPFFLTDIEGATVFLATAMQSPYMVDKENSYLDQVKGFPANVEVGAKIHLTSTKPANFVNLPDPRSMFLTYRYSITEIPEAPDFIPRIADDRVGHFLALFQDYSDDRRDTTYLRYVTRWNLQKEEPYAEMSKPKEPITFWLENNIPKQYRKAVADGILVWNKAFERIGFKDAVVVKQQPDDADWDPADARYATVRWFVTTTSSFAIGPSRINPWTGQIFDADIGVAEAIVRNTRYEFQELSDPVGVLRRIAESMYASVAPDGAPGDASALAASSGGPLNCTLGTGIAQQAAFGYSLLAARGMQPGSEEEDRYVNDFITHVMAHEVGHTLGLRHNFRASQVQPFDQLQNTARTNQQGLTGSVMDYIPVNLAPSGGTQGQYWQTTLGDYDHWAIEYAYRTIPGVKTSEDELPELRKTATRVAEAGLHYGTDEDNSEPRTNMWDIGQDTLAYHRARVGLARELWSRIPTTLAKEGEGYQKIRRSFEAGLFELFPAAINVSKTIGGIHTHRDHVGDPQGRLPYEPVPAERQREALAFLRQNLFESDSFRLSSDLLNRLAASRWWDFDFSVFRMPRTEFPLHDTVLFMQQVTLNQLYSPIKLDRLQDLEMHYGAGQKPFTMAEMFNGLYESIWSEVGPSGSKSIDSFRRGLQRAHLEKLIGLLVRPLPGTPEDAGTMARANLVDLKGRIDATLRAGSGADALTRAHLEETRSRIEAALQAQMIRISG